MAVTGLVNRTPDDLKGTRKYVRYVSGTGSPIGDSEMANDKKFPVGSTYIDIATGLQYVKYAATLWKSVGKFTQSTTLLVDGAFFVAPRACVVTAVQWVHAVAGTDGSAVNVQLVKDTGTNAPGAGTDLLTNNTNAGFNCKGTANTVQNGTLTATAASLKLAAGDRLSVDYAGTLTTLAGVVMTVELEWL
jgi:hypothetical protein